MSKWDKTIHKNGHTDFVWVVTGIVVYEGIAERQVLGVFTSMAEAAKKTTEWYETGAYAEVDYQDHDLRYPLAKKG